MARFLICLGALGLAASAPAPTYVAPQPAVATHGYAPAAAVVASQPAVVGYTSHPVVSKVLKPGAPIVHKVPRTGVVGHKTVQVGSQQVVAGHQYVHAGTEHHQPPSVSFIAEPATNSQSTVPIAPPAIPAPTRTVAGPVKVYGPAPADTVIKTPVQGLARTHSIITPQQTVIKPELQVNKVPYEVPVHIPVPVERKVIIDKPVANPVKVEVPVAVPVSQPYKVHPVQKVVVNPVIDKHTVSVHAPAIHGIAAPAAVAGYAAAPAAVAALPSAGYAAAPAAVAALPAVGYATAALPAALPVASNH